MKDSDTIETLEKRKSKWDRIVNGLKTALGLYAFLVLTYLAVQGIAAQQQLATVLQKVNETTDQVRQSQLEGQKTGTENHEKTRQYIECLFTAVLTVPLAECTNIDFDTCTKEVDGQSKNTDMQQGSTSQPNSVLPTQPATTPKPSEPVAAAPPDPDPSPDDRSALGKLPIIGGLFDAIGL